MAERYLICNADDFGMGRGVTDAIIDCHRQGIVTSTSLMANMSAAQYAAQRAKEVPELGIGVHLNLTEGRPVSSPEEVPDLVDDRGCFHCLTEQYGKLWFDKRVKRQVEKEFAAQVQKALDLGIQPTHGDSHHGVHKYPACRSAAIAVLRRFGILGIRTHKGGYWHDRVAPWSVRCRSFWRNLRSAPRSAYHVWGRWRLVGAGLKAPDRLVNLARYVPASPLSGPVERMVACLRALPHGRSEIAVHPGYTDPEVVDPEEFAGTRESDTEMCMHPSVVAAVQDAGIKLITYADL